MIPVRLAPEPPDFDEKVRKPGQRAIAARVGDPPSSKHPGRKREKRAERPEDLKPEDFPPLWIKATESLLTAYGRLCAYACLYIERTTGAATVDHWAPKSKRWDRVYEWDNYRLACSLMNTRKNDFGDVIDPFTVQDGLFALDLVSLKAVPGPAAGARTAEVEATIERLGLDGSDYKEALADYHEAYVQGHISLRWLEKRAPFLVREMRRQNKLRPSDS